MKTMIVYESTHHGNTKKLLDALCLHDDVDLVSVDEISQVQWNHYDNVGIASGIAFGKFYKNIETKIQDYLPHHQNVFLIYTCGKDAGFYTRSIKKILQAKECQILGEFGCLGYDTYGPFAMIGGISKGHPNEKDIQDFLLFYQDMMK